ncbi:MAG: NusG domain II-containing protein [Treponema sp.]|jgi:hypothetical protein|nr:NusG domain II-containing protein [Treponema sp.]
MRIVDIIALTVSITAAVGSALIVYTVPHTTVQAVIKGSDRTWIFPVDAEETVHIPGPLGDTIITIEQGNVRVLSSPCTNQLCVSAGAINRHGEWVACLPNYVFVSIEGKDAAYVDSTTW